MFDVISLSRLQFAATTIYHFLFVPLTLGLSIIIAILATLAYKKKDEDFKNLSEFFGKLFFINFAVGVVTGIVQEFQFGMNWSGYSRFVGDIFGAPLAIEALSAFFLESTFLGVWMFGKGKISEKTRLIAIWIVAFASNLSALWILIANSFMQVPKGFVLRNGRAEMVDFWAIVSNKQAVLAFTHTFTAALVTAACFVACVCAYKMLKNSNPDMFIKALRITLPLGLVATILVAVIGDLQTKYLASVQPMKLAAMEAHWETEKAAPLSLLAVINQESQSNTAVIDAPIPGLLSFMTYNDFKAEVKGIKELQQAYESKFGPGNYIPPVGAVYYSFRLMVITGILMLLAFIIGTWMLWKNKTIQSTLFLKILIFMLPLPYIANATGWIVTELGRFPWIVYNVLTLQQGVSKVLTQGELIFTLLGYTLLYGVLAVINVYLMKKVINTFSKENRDAPKSESEVEVWS